MNTSLVIKTLTLTLCLSAMGNLSAAGVATPHAANPTTAPTWSADTAKEFIVQAIAAEKDSLLSKANGVSITNSNGATSSDYPQADKESAAAAKLAEPYTPHFYESAETEEKDPADRKIVRNPGETDDAYFERIKTAVQTAVTGGKYRPAPVTSIKKNGSKTGMIGRGTMYYYGENPAADAVVFSEQGGKLKVLLKPDSNNKLTILGGTLRQGLDLPKTAFKAISDKGGISEATLTTLKTQGKIVDLGTVYTGFSDDPRNTDDAYMTTTAFGYLIDPSSLSSATFSDAQWHGVEEVLAKGDEEFFASHKYIIAKAVSKLLN